MALACRKPTPPDFFGPFSSQAPSARETQQPTEILSPPCQSRRNPSSKCCALDWPTEHEKGARKAGARGGGVPSIKAGGRQPTCLIIQSNEQ